MISIIISAYNSEKTIEKAINSCINQTYKDLEIIVVEDCSTDNTKDIIKSINDPRIVLLENQTNQGAGMSRRIGTKAAIDELHDSTAYNNSATNAAIPVALVCSDGTLYTQSLFNS